MSSQRLWSVANFTLSQSRRCFQTSPVALRHSITLNDMYLGIQSYSPFLNRTRYHSSRFPSVRPTETNYKIRPGRSALFSSTATNTNVREFDLVVIGAGRILHHTQRTFRPKPNASVAGTHSRPYQGPLESLQANSTLTFTPNQRLQS